MERKKKPCLFNLINIIGIQLDEEQRNKLCFRENLVIGKLTENPKDTPIAVGGMCLDVQLGVNDKIIIYVSSKFNINDGSSGGSKITTLADLEFHTIEEQRMEYYSSKDLNIIQKLYVGMESRGLLVKNVYKKDRHEPAEVSSKCFRLGAVVRFIGEGVNFVLMRMLAICKYKGRFEMSTLYINGDLCRNIYFCHGAEKAYVNNAKLKIVKIKRRIIEECGIIHECYTVLTTSGQIVKQEWKDCEFVLHMNPMLDLTSFTICGCDTKVPPKDWEEDIKLFSEYLDRKYACSHKIQNYMRQEPGLAELLSDYVKSLLMHKPTKVVEYTADYFRRYASIFED